MTGQQATGDLTISNPNPSVGDLLRVNVANLLDGNGLAADVVITMTAGIRQRPMARSGNRR